MFAKIGAWLEAKGFNHTQANIAIVLACLLVIYLALTWTFPVPQTDKTGKVVITAVTAANPREALSRVGTIAVNVGTFVPLFFGLVYFLRSVGVNVWSAIFDENKAAPAIVVGLLSVAFAILCAL